MVANRELKINDIDFSYSNVKDRGAAALSPALSTRLPYLRNLNLEYCKLTHVGISSIISSLLANPKIVTHIRRLCLSGNKCGSSGSTALYQFLNYWGRNFLDSSLLCLEASGCDLDYGKCFSSFNNLNNSVGASLQELDLSLNKYKDKTGWTKFVQFIEGLRCLNKLNLSGCGLPVPSLCELLEAINRNFFLRYEDFFLDISYNNVSNGIFSLLSFFESSTVIKRLNIRGNNLRTDGFIALLKAVVKNGHFRSLNISQNIQSLKKKGTTTNPLIQLLQSCKLEELNISENGLGDDLADIIGLLGENKTLQSLNICKNALSDSAALLLGTKVLPFNETLKDLYCDQNNFSLEGWQTLVHGLQRNGLLQKLSLSNKEVNRVISLSKERELARAKIGEIIINRITFEKTFKTII